MDLTKDIIFFSTADWDCPFWTNKQHMAVALAERGYRILYVESLGLRRPTSGKRDIARVFGRLRKWASGLREVRENIWVFSLIVMPYHGNSWVNSLNIRILCRYTRKYMRYLKFMSPILWTYNPLSIYMVGRFNESMVVYHCVDDLTAAPGMPVNAILKLEKKLVRRADIIFTTSPKLQETRSGWNPNNTYYFPNVADFNHFSTSCLQDRVPEDMESIPHPRIGFIGAISEYKVDFKLISFVAEKRKDWHWVMIGQVGEGQPKTSVDLLKRANIHFLGPKLYQILPDYLRGFDVAVLPCTNNDYTTSMFPLKFFEYLSAGKPVVATDLPALRHYADACILTHTPNDFIQALDSVFKGKMPDKKKCLELAQEHTWQKRLDQMEKLFIEKLTQKAGNIRVGINASKFFEVNTGVGRYTSNLCKSILETDGKNDYFLYSPGRMDNTIIADRARIRIKKTGITLQNNTLRILWEQVTLPYCSMNDRLDLFHYTDHALSLFQKTHPIIITVHDIAYVRFPWLLNKSRQIYKKYILNMSIKRADVIVADSCSTKRDIINYFEIKEEKIKVVYPGVESRFRPIRNIKEYRLRNNLPSKMILNVGTLEPRKNVVALIKAFKKLRKLGFKNYKLVIAGDKGWLYKPIFDEIKSSGLQKEVLFLGCVKDEDLPILYNCADVFVYPSLYEGFGFPPLEAMACGIPVITSNTSSLPEVVGNAGIMVDPDDVNSLCEAIYNVLKDKELWHRMSEKGLERAKLFSWKETAKKILEIYDKVLSKNNY